MPASCLPRIYDMSIAGSKEEVTRLKADSSNLDILDTIQYQIEDLIRCSHPSRSLTAIEIAQHQRELLAGLTLEDFGSWIYYPWSNKLVHLLSEYDFIKVRTNRNRNKITQAEQDTLAQKSIGLIGLSVGHSVAHTLAMERSFGELRIADFDVLDLSNLNRIRSNVFNIGIPKTVLMAREIAELDPYLKVTCYHEGITESNIDGFLQGLDLLIDECDSIDIKMIARERARENRIPVIMETSDRGMLDIERYDLDAEAPILHGLVDDLRSEDLKNLTNEEKIPYVSKILDVENMSVRLKESMKEIGRSISTWPQLASDVMHGGGSVAIAARLLLTEQEIVSGRYLLDPAKELMEH